jgi:hypothetical protein
MTTATATLDPGETIVAAMRELYDSLREIVDRGPTDDPSLLDEIGKLTGRIRSRITRARKKAEPTAAEASRSQETVATGGTADTAPPISAAPAREIQPQTGTADAPTVPRHRAVPAPRRSDEITVRLPRPGARGRHRQHPVGLPRWVHTLVILLMVAGVALATTVTPWAITGALAGATVLGVARRRNARRRSSWTGGAQ